MRRPIGSIVLACFGWIGLTSAACAHPSSLRLIPAEAELVVVVPRPARLWTAVYEHPVRRDLAQHELVQALYDTTNFHRLEQLIVHFEKKLGQNRFDILDQLTAKGAVLGARLSSEPAALLAVEARDEALLRSFLSEAVEIVDQELGRQESKDRFHKESHGKVATVHFGKNLHLAQVGAFLLVSSEKKLLRQAIDLQGKPAKEGVASRVPRKERGKDVLVWSWLDFEGLKRNDAFRDGLKSATMEGFLKLVAGAFLDVLKRTPSMDFELTQEGKDFRLRIGMPRGRDGMSEVARSFVTTEERRLLPALQPPRVITSTSWTFDMGHIWKNKEAWLGKFEAEQLDDLERTIKPFLGGASLGDLLHEAGWNQRIVSTQPGDSPYKIKPGQPSGAFAVVFDIREKRFAQTMSKALRAGALVGTFQFGMKMKEEKHRGHTLVTYHFDEKRKVAGDSENIRFNFSPSFGQVGNNFLVSSTAELARDLVDCLAKDEKRLPAGTSFRTDLYAMGLADSLKSVRQEMLATAILDQGLPPKEASKQVDELVELVRSLGVVRWEIHYGTDESRIDLLWEYGRQ